MTEKWSYWQDPIELAFRLREDIDGGRNHRIVGVVLKESDAKLICEAVNGLKSEQKT